MQELIKIETAIINGTDQQTVNARDLHAFLGVKSDFKNWIKNRIEDFGFVENQDYVSFGKNLPKPQGGRPSVEYFVSINMAKELAMVERNEKGKLARLYFIECERVAKEKQVYGKTPAIPEGLPNFTDPAEAAIAWAQKVKLLQAAEKKTKELEAANQQLTDQAAVNAPKVTFANSITSGDTEVTITVAAKTLGIGPRKFFDWLRMNSFLYKQANQATQYAIEKGYMVTRFAKITHDDDSVEKKPYPHVTGKGLFYFYGRLLKEGLIAKNDNLELAA